MVFFPRKSFKKGTLILVVQKTLDITTTNDMDSFEQHNIKSDSLINSGSVSLRTA